MTTAMRIPFGTVTITESAKRRVMRALETGRISSGRLVREFEEKFAEKIGAREAVAVSSGTDADALCLALLHDLGAQPGDEVILPALSFVATANAVLHARLTPVFVDVEADGLNIDPRKITGVITARTRAILPVHLMGKPANMNAIKAIADRHGLLVIEDAAEAHGALYEGRPVGAIGDLGAFSLYVAHIITTGEGGIITTQNTEYARLLRSLRAHGRACACKTCVSNLTSGFCEKRFQGSDTGDIRFQFDRVGYSSKMNELEAAIGLGALEEFEEILSRRRRNLKSMMRRAEELKGCLWTFSEESFERIGPHALPLVVSEEAPFSRNELIWHLERIGVDARTLFNSIPTQCGAYRFLKHSIGDFPNAERIGQRGLHIGVHQDITADDIDWLFDALKTFARRLERKKRPSGQKSSLRRLRPVAESVDSMGSRSERLPT